MVGVDVVPDPGEEDEIEEPLSHFLLQVGCEDSGCLNYFPSF